MEQLLRRKCLTSYYLWSISTSALCSFETLLIPTIKSSHNTWDVLFHLGYFIWQPFYFHVLLENVLSKAFSLLAIIDPQECEPRHAIMTAIRPSLSVHYLIIIIIQRHNPYKPCLFTGTDLSIILMVRSEHAAPFITITWEDSVKIPCHFSIGRYTSWIYHFLWI